MWIAVVIALLPRPAVAQQALFVEGLAALARTMLTSSGDASRATAAIEPPCRSRPIRSMTPA
jgi:hypothetical protein